MTVRSSEIPGIGFSMSCTGEQVYIGSVIVTNERRRRFQYLTEPGLVIMMYPSRAPAT